MILDATMQGEEGTYPKSYVPFVATIHTHIEKVSYFRL